MRIFSATLGTETNTFSPIPSGMQAFRDGMLMRPGEIPEAEVEYASPLMAAKRRAASDDWDVVEGTCAFCQPGGLTVRAVYESLRDEILDQLKAALPVDIVALQMHGAMVADGYADCEGDVLTRIREIVGAEVAVGLEIDPHCHMTGTMIEHADAILCFKEYPHTDFRERAEELLDILAGKAKGDVIPTMSLTDCHMIGMYHTTAEPMKGFVSKIQSLEGQNGILSISVAHGFPWGDVPDMGTKVLVITDNRAQEGQALADQLAAELYELRGKTGSEQLPMDVGVKQAWAAKAFPVVLADSTDNPGGGAPCDSTFLLREFIAQGVDSACLGPLWDPVAVQQCFEAGVGATLDLRIGGKMGPTSGDPLDLHIEVTALCDELLQTFAGTDTSLGIAAAINYGGIEIALTSNRTQALGPDLFTNLGIDPKAKKLVAVKSSHHFYAGFAPLAAEVLHLDGPGTLGADVTQLTYRNIERPKWPFDENPVGAG